MATNENGFYTPPDITDPLLNGPIGLGKGSQLHANFAEFLGVAMECKFRAADIALHLIEEERKRCADDQHHGMLQGYDFYGVLNAVRLMITDLMGIVDAHKIELRRRYPGQGARQRILQCIRDTDKELAALERLYGYTADMLRAEKDSPDLRLVD